MSYAASHLKIVKREIDVFMRLNVSFGSCCLLAGRVGDTVYLYQT